MQAVGLSVGATGISISNFSTSADPGTVQTICPSRPKNGSLGSVDAVGEPEASRGEELSGARAIHSSRNGGYLLRPADRDELAHAERLQPVDVL